MLVWTTSQDADVDRAANAIVSATASLEVGFNDPRVGAVIQHKSPHDTAAFLQRKGRAGRTRDDAPLDADRPVGFRPRPDDIPGIRATV